jgi:AcrR family transcriptional regulator
MTRFRYFGGDVAFVNILSYPPIMERPRAYHHGNLKQALINAAVTLIGEAGPRGFTLREVARRAKVSHNAPYRHFRDKEDLLAAVGMQGFQRLTMAMKRAAKTGYSPQERLLLCGRGYVGFALRWPQHFQVMFDLPSENDRHAEYAEAGRAAFATLLNIVVECQQSGALEEGDSQKVSFITWSMVHGVAKLAISHQLPFRNADLLEFTDTVSRVLLSGLDPLKSSRPTDRLSP